MLFHSIGSCAVQLCRGLHWNNIQLFTYLKLYTQAPRPPPHSPVPSQSKMAVVTDRKLYRVNETVYVKGYARTYTNGDGVAAAAQDSLQLSVVWSDTDTYTGDVTLDDGMCAWVWACMEVLDLRSPVATLVCGLGWSMSSHPTTGRPFKTAYCVK